MNFPDTQEGLEASMQAANLMTQRGVIPGEPKYWRRNGTGTANEFNFTEPSLLLTCPIDTVRDASFKGDREWYAFQHQTAGYACRHPEAIVTRLNPTADTWEGMIRLDDHYLGSCVGMWGVALDELVEYRNHLREWLDVDCNFTYTQFEEAWYPIDYSSENVAKLCTDELPGDLREFLEFDGTLGELVGINRWSLVVIGHNCD